MTNKKQTETNTWTIEAFGVQVHDFEIESRRKDDKAKMDATQNCPKQLAQPKGPLFSDKQEELF